MGWAGLKLDNSSHECIRQVDKDHIDAHYLKCSRRKGYEEGLKRSEMNLKEITSTYFSTGTGANLKFSMTHTSTLPVNNDKCVTEEKFY